MCKAITKTSLIFLIAGNSACSFSQQPSFTEMPSLKFGFLVAINHTSSVPDFKGHFGFSNGIIAEYPIAKWIFICPQPSLTFLAYKRLDNKGGERFLEYTQMEFPLYLEIKPFGKKIKPVFAAGPNFKYDLAGKNSFRAFDVSIGFEKQLEYCAVSPSLRYSRGREIKAFYLAISFKG